MSAAEAAETNATFTVPTLTVELLKSYLDSIDKGVKVMAFIVKLTPGTADDKALAAVQSCLDYANSHLNDEWLAVALVLLNKILATNNVAAILDHLKLLA